MTAARTPPRAQWSSCAYHAHRHLEAVIQAENFSKSKARKMNCSVHQPFLLSIIYLLLKCLYSISYILSLSRKSRKRTLQTYKHWMLQIVAVVVLWLKLLMHICLCRINLNVPNNSVPSKIKLLIIPHPNRQVLGDVFCCSRCLGRVAPSPDFMRQ